MGRASQILPIYVKWNVKLTQSITYQLVASVVAKLVMEKSTNMTVASLSWGGPWGLHLQMGASSLTQLAIKS